MKTLWVGAVSGVAWMLAAAAPAREAQGGVVFIAPVRPSVLQVLQDVVQRRPGNLLVSYQAGKTEADVILHRWDGQGWVFVSNEAYRAGRLMRARPRRIVLFGPDEVLPDQLVLDSEAWAPVVLGVADMDHGSLLTTAGRLLDFTPAEWRFYAQRYGLRLADENVPLREDEWFDQPREPRRFRLPDAPVPPRRRERPRRAEEPRPEPARVPAAPPAERREAPPPRVEREPEPSTPPEAPVRRRRVRAPSPETDPATALDPLPEVRPPPEPESVPPEEPLLPSPVRAAPEQPEADESELQPAPRALPGIK